MILTSQRQPLHCAGSHSNKIKMKVSQKTLGKRVLLFAQKKRAQSRYKKAISFLTVHKKRQKKKKEKNSCQPNNQMKRDNFEGNFP